jgi:L-ascorbate metabolism protein UlaG (beta-lactamase superfamily)
MVHEILKRIYWLGHDGFRIEGEKVIYFDPYQITATVPADIIFISHEHYDHCSVEDIQKILKNDTVIVTDSSSAGNLSGDIRVVKPGDRLIIDTVPVEVVPSYNVDKTFHPKASGMLGFIVTIDGVRIYHAGDTDFIPEMKDIHADIALLPVSGTYVMTAEEAAEAALTIKPVVVIPMHFGCIVGSEADAKLFAEKLKGKIKVKIPRKNQ